jgi:hypothetical protein
MSQPVAIAKFKVGSITRTQHMRPVTGEDGKTVYERGEMRTVKLSPVTGTGNPNDENSRFWAATPSGLLELGCVNAEAVAELELGREFYVQLVPAD